MVVSRLTSNEVRLMNMIAEGMTNKEIAQATGKALPTVKNTLVRIKDKLGARNSPHAVRLMMEQS